MSEDDRERRVSEFGLAVVLDTDLRKLHKEGRVSDAMRLIEWAFDRVRADERKALRHPDSQVQVARAT